MNLVIGPYTLGEVPPAFSYQFLDCNGLPINLTGYAAYFSVQEFDGTVQHGASPGQTTITNMPEGIVTHVWDGSEFTTAGRYKAYFWAGNGVNRYASVPISFTVQLAVGPIPAI